MSCCGKIICSGCVHTFRSRATKRKDDVCPFCRTPMPISLEEMVKRLEKRIDLNDALALNNHGCNYAEGQLGLPQNQAKALELWHRAAELGNAAANYAIGNAYLTGDGVEVDEKKAMHYWELAAMRGSVDARHNFGVTEENKGNWDRALKHYMIAVKDGGSDSLKNIKIMYEEGHATKDVYNEALKCYQAYVDEIKSDQRDEAAALYGKYY